MDDRFSVSALHRLEAAGVPVVTSLKMEIENNPGQISRILYRQEEWAKEWEKGACHLPPTWRSLFEMLKELDLEDLSQEVQTYLTGELVYILLESSSPWLLASFPGSWLINCVYFLN